MRKTFSLTDFYVCMGGWSVFSLSIIYNLMKVYQDTRYKMMKAEHVH